MNRPKSSMSAGIAPLQLVVGAAVLLLVVGLAVPILTDQIATEARARAIGDLRQIAADVLSYRRDTRQWPGGPGFAFTDGTAAFGETALASGKNGLHLSSFLALNTPPVPNWHGPYMSISRPDPWGHRYVLLLDGLQDPQRRAGWILSAGPNGVFDTSKLDREPLGDDLGLLLR